MSFDEIRKHQENRRINILKGFSDFDGLQKSSESEDDSLEKAKQYADNYTNKKLNRVGQTYGKDGQPESPAGESGKTEEGNVDYQMGKKDDPNQLPNPPAEIRIDPNNENPNTPDENQPNQEGQYSTEELAGFAQEAEDWQLQEFINDASKSGDNSEYMQAQINIAQDELNRRVRPTSDTGEGAEVDAQDLNNVQSDATENAEGQEGMEQEGENTGEVDYANSDSVKNYLMSNPEAKQAVVDMMMDDVMLSPAQALRIHQAQTTSGGEALQHVEEAKRTLDELHAKLGGSNDNSEVKRSEQRYEETDNDYRARQEAEGLLREVLSDGSDYEDAQDFLNYVRQDNDFVDFTDEDVLGFYEENMSDEAQGNREEMNQNRNEAEEGDDEEDYDYNSEEEKENGYSGKKVRDSQDNFDKNQESEKGESEEEEEDKKKK